ncbi:hypothetical protein EN794_029805 [Mesorhizobium sp. M00.F.Ca.ET.151.01.1.1]|nr:MAG: hypothetical protein EOS72_18450 [Mesorhizobium sp.]TGP89091.1 hypothetical protein EN861_26980 [Mesorhizobium sp. M8A.F.Ca.ET.218.01.1.1]TGQ94382.1 hypothetical protein EN851_02040 [Mesorhizobium sp. M8A.F.Ca.ET.208.01.1.1]TGR26159.1 hypothetical protein EN840_16390 [Mesorhizobium sp. M8A.F.Ca.ET.197.01.1.1]TGR26610.1 hypothetical protein EN845_16190 [Mesorhizobium sp. M8A.F.Ca.ET.202.01.1.1]TGR41434.1 hypothetical protein EN842_36415 [bacterium M00.F.Ca.ET.199.01.1.1]TGR50926.1 hypo
MFPDRTDPETETLLPRNPSDTWQAHLPRIERRPRIVLGHGRSSREMKMSMFENLGRFGVTIRQAHARNKAIRALNSLPAHVQKDIGWPASPPNDPQVTLASLLLGTTR